MQTFTQRINLKRIIRKFAAQHCRQSTMQGIKHIAILGFGPKRGARGIATYIAQLEPHKRFCHRKPFYNVIDSRGFSAVCAQKF